MIDFRKGFNVTGSNGTLFVLPDGRIEGPADIFATDNGEYPVRMDIAEWRANSPCRLLAPWMDAETGIDALDIGWWTNTGRYIPARDDWREDTAKWLSGEENDIRDSMAVLENAFIDTSNRLISSRLAENPDENDESAFLPATFGDPRYAEVHDIGVRGPLVGSGADIDPVRILYAFDDDAKNDPLYLAFKKFLSRRRAEFSADSPKGTEAEFEKWLRKTRLPSFHILFDRGAPGFRVTVRIPVDGVVCEEFSASFPYNFDPRDFAEQVRTEEPAIGKTVFRKTTSCGFSFLSFLADAGHVAARDAHIGTLLRKFAKRVFSIDTASEDAKLLRNAAIWKVALRSMEAGRRKIQLLVAVDERGRFPDRFHIEIIPDMDAEQGFRVKHAHIDDGTRGLVAAHIADMLRKDFYAIAGGVPEPPFSRFSRAIEPGMEPICDVLSRVTRLSWLDTDAARDNVNQALGDVPDVTFLGRESTRTHPAGLVFRIAPEDGEAPVRVKVFPVLGEERLDTVVRGGNPETRKMARKRILDLLTMDESVLTPAEAQDETSAPRA